MSEISSKCNRCGTPLPPDAPEGLCPRCLVALNLATQTEITGETDPHGPSIPKPPPAPVSEIAKLFPQLEILECLGRGGMGAVYKARQPRLDRLVALKILSPEKQSDSKFAERFEREARTLARLHHPNIVTVYDFGGVQGNYYLLMEFVDGLTLRQLFQARKLSPAEALKIVPEICKALQYAHEQGIVHRDINPENILLDKQGRVKIADFGIAKMLGTEAGQQTLTGAKDVVGTPHYMAPEQIEKPTTVDHRADIYSLGVVFYEMLTGELPLGKFQPPSSKVQIDVRLDEVVLHALEKEPERRYQQASQVKTAVETIAASPSAAAASGTDTSAVSRRAVPERRMRCFMSTPEYLRTFTGRWLWIYTGKGELRLDAENLSFVSGLNVIVIPLAEVIELNLGHYPRTAKPARLDYIAVTFAEAGHRRTLYFTPTSSAWLPVWETNRYVAECFRAIREAVIARTGRPPRGSSDDALPQPSMLAGLSRGVRTAFPIFLVSALIAGAAAFFMARRPASRFVLSHLTIRSTSIGQPIAGEVKSDYIGQSYFPKGDSIEITSVDRTKERMVVKGHYDLVSHDQATLALYITTSTNIISVLADAKERMQIAKGRGDFELIDSHLVPGLPHVSMYADGESFAAVYFGTKAEVLEEGKAKWIAETDQTADGEEKLMVTFGPVIERVVNDMDAETNNLIDLDTGIMSSLPPSIMSDDATTYERWCRKVGVDISGRSKTRPLLCGLSLICDPVAIDQWNKLTQSNLDTFLQRHANNYAFPGEAIGGTTGTDIHQPTYLFKTREGGLGILQITGYTENRRGVKIRYKLVQTAKPNEVIDPATGLPIVTDGVRIDPTIGLPIPIAGTTGAAIDSTTGLPITHGSPVTIDSTTGLPTESKSESEVAVVSTSQKWLALIDAGNYSECWKQASAIFQGGVAEPSWENSMNTFRKPLGNLVSRKLKSAQPMTELPGAPDGQYVVMQFETSFANKKSTIETVTFMLEKDGQWKSAGYFIK